MRSRRSPISRGPRPSSRITTSRIEAWRERSFAPYPLAAWAEFTFDGVPIRLGQVVQTLARVSGVGGVYEPLVVTPAIGVRVEPEARILPLDGSPLPVRVTVHAQHAAEGTVELKLPAGLAVRSGAAGVSFEERGRHRAAGVFGFTGGRREDARLRD